jgi:hypothetical protein
MRSLTSHEGGVVALWKWFKTNYQELRDVIGDGLGSFARILDHVTTSMATEEQFDDVQNFFVGKDTEVGGGEERVGVPFANVMHAGF